MINKKILEYSESHTTKEPELLKKLYRETNLKVIMPRMLSGHSQGVLLKLFSWMIRPKYILEIGTYTGYSAICLAEGLTDEGELITIEKNPEVEDIARRYFSESGQSEKIDFRIGNAKKIIPDLNLIFDIVFIDADKENYLNYYNLTIDKLRKGGIIIADNTLWEAKVLQTPNQNDKETIGIQKFNDFVQADKRVENILLPIRDGLTIIRKL
ncbi:MAG: class I SAM-dependent methyltransferase [Bacteroidales bacterium]|nr:class I SAM-dependent methyltransferase [Bacteroidales bacterium]